MQAEQISDSDQLVSVAELKKKKLTILPPSETLKCDLWNLVGDNEKNLNMHMKNHNEGGDDSETDHATTVASKLIKMCSCKHIKITHTRSLNYMCDYCKKTFDSSKELKIHIHNSHNKTKKPWRNFF